MAVSDDDERFWSIVWPKLDAGSWRYELQARRVARAAATVGAEVRAVESNMDDDVGGCSSHLGTGAGVDGDAGAKLRGERDQYCEEGSKELQNQDEPWETRTVPVFFPPPRGVATGALEEALRRNLPADGSAGARRPDRFEGAEAVMELLSQVPGFPAAMAHGTAPNMEVIAAAAEAISFRPSTPPKPTARRVARATERLAARYPASEKLPDEVYQQISRTFSKPPKRLACRAVNFSLKRGKVSRRLPRGPRAGSCAACAVARKAAAVATRPGGGYVGPPTVTCPAPASDDPCSP